MANLALTAYIRENIADDYNLWRHLVLPWIGTLALLPVLFITVYPVPAWPVNLTPYIFIVALLVGFGYMMWLRAPQARRAAPGRDRCWSAAPGRRGGRGLGTPGTRRRCGLAGRGVTHPAVELGRVELPGLRAADTEQPSIPPRPTGPGSARPASAAAAGLDALVVYADREHFANL